MGTEPVKHGSLYAAKAFVIGEEEELVAAVENVRNHNRATDGDTKLVLLKVALLNAVGIFEEVGGVQNVVAEKFPSGAVELVGAGLDGGVQERRRRSGRTRR